MKRTFKKAISVFLVLAMLLCAAPLNGFTELDLSGLFSIDVKAADYSGSCGNNLTWSLDINTGVLEITGTGPMDDWTLSSVAPWADYAVNINSAVIDEGVTSVGSYAFKDMAELATNAAYIEYVMLIDQSAGMHTGIIPEPDMDNAEQGTTTPETNGAVESVTENNLDIDVIIANIFEIFKKIFAFIFSLIIK